MSATLRPRSSCWMTEPTDGYIDEAMGTALHRASDLGDEAMATLLLDHGANINARAPALREHAAHGRRRERKSAHDGPAAAQRCQPKVARF